MKRKGWRQGESVPLSERGWPERQMVPLHLYPLDHTIDRWREGGGRIIKKVKEKRKNLHIGGALKNRITWEIEKTQSMAT